MRRTESLLLKPLFRGIMFLSPNICTNSIVLVQLKRQLVSVEHQ